MIKVSIIVPVYNIERLLPRCIDSILAQTYKDFELILVDDGSPDNSGKICDEYAGTDKRIKVVHKQNGGVSSARNAGLDQAVGEFIMFCDSDDSVEPCWCEKMLTLFESEHIDLGLCGYSMVDAETNANVGNKILSDEEISIYNRNEVFEFRKAQVIECVWNKIFRKKIIDDFSLRFDESLSYGEDFLFVMKYIQSAKGDFAFYNTALYDYAIGMSESLSNKYIDKLWSIMQYIYDEFDRTLECCGVDISSIPKADYYKSPIWFVIYSLNNTMSKQNKSGFLKKYKENAEILHSERCKTAFKNGSFDNYNPLLARILKTRCFLLIYLFNKAVEIKNGIFSKKSAKRIGIITINDNKNYGNRLQAFAMQQYLKKFGFSSEDILFSNYDNSFYKKEKQSPILALKNALAKIPFINKLIKRIKHRQDSLIEIRIKAFTQFNKKHIAVSKEKIKGSKVSRKTRSRYDYFVAGSDQIWNPTFGLGTPVSYLQFTPKKKRIAISASFGVDEMPEQFKNQARHYLDGMHFISVREETGRQIVRELTGNDCEVFLDPTMLVSPDVYSPLLESAKAVLPENYVLCFFLGELSDKRKSFIERFAAEKGCQTVYLNSPDYPEQFVYDPCDFLKAIKNCRYFFTDSFHGCVFSILFQRQLFAMEREGKTVKMSGRIRTLFEKFGLTDRLVCEDDTLPEPISETRFEKIFAILENERKRTTDILSQILK